MIDIDAILKCQHLTDEEWNSEYRTTGFSNGNGIASTIFDISLNKPLLKNSRISCNGKELIILSDGVFITTEWANDARKYYNHSARIVSGNPTISITPLDIEYGKVLEDFSEQGDDLIPINVNKNE